MCKLFLFAVAAMTLIVAAPKSEAQALPQPPEPSATSPSQPAPNTLTGVYTQYRQTDDRWRHVRLGNRTMGRIGCLVSSLAMASPRFGVSKDPEALARDLEAHGAITRSGDLVIEKLPEVLPVRVRRVPYLGSGSLRDMADMLTHGMVVVLQLDHSASGMRGQHWVTVVTCNDHDVFVMDPANGLGTLLSLYGKIGIKSLLVLASAQQS